MTFQPPVVHHLEDLTPEMVTFCADVLEVLYVTDPNTGASVTVTSEEVREDATRLQARVAEIRETRRVQTAINAYFEAAHGGMPKKVHPHVYAGMKAAVRALSWTDDGSGF